MLISSCEWCSAWKRQNASTRWLDKCEVQLARSMSTSTTDHQRPTRQAGERMEREAAVEALQHRRRPRADQRHGGHGHRDVRGRDTAASWRCPTAPKGRATAGHSRSAPEGQHHQGQHGRPDQDDALGHHGVPRAARRRGQRAPAHGGEHRRGPDRRPRARAEPLVAIPSATGGIVGVVGGGWSAASSWAVRSEASLSEAAPGPAWSA